jgi:transcriptional regulator with XRE-family HTH domain
MEDREKIEAIGDLIHEYWGELERRGKKRYSLNEMARHFGVNPTSLSYWQRRLRLPDEENKQRLAEKIGYVRFYRAIGEQPRIPEDDKTEKMVDAVMRPGVTESDVDAAIEFLEERRKKRATQKGPIAS